MKEKELSVYRHVLKSKLYIENYYYENINLDDLAEESSYSKYHFLRLFKKSYGLTPNNFLVDVRLKHSLLLLKEGNTIQDTCWEVGFSSLSSFSLLFKNKYGFSPTTYRTRNNKLKRIIENNPRSLIPNCFAEKFKL